MLCMNNAYTLISHTWSIVPLRKWLTTLVWVETIHVDYPMNEWSHHSCHFRSVGWSSKCQLRKTTHPPSQLAISSAKNQQNIGDFISQKHVGLAEKGWRLNHTWKSNATKIGSFTGAIEVKATQKAGIGPGNWHWKMADVGNSISVESGQPRMMPKRCKAWQVLHSHCRCWPQVMFSPDARGCRIVMFVGAPSTSWIYHPALHLRTLSMQIIPRRSGNFRNDAIASPQWFVPSMDELSRY